MNVNLIKRLVAAGVDDATIQEVMDLQSEVYRLNKQRELNRMRQSRWRTNHPRNVTNVNNVTSRGTIGGNPSNSSLSSSEPLSETEKVVVARDKLEVAEVSKFPDQEDLDLALDAYHQVAEVHGLPKVRKLTEARKRKLRCRLIDAGSLEVWYEACHNLEKAKWMHGDNDGGWRADLDFMLQQSSFVRLIEGKYNGKEAQVFSTGRKFNGISH
jgi:hypothetical protein